MSPGSDGGNASPSATPTTQTMRAQIALRERILSGRLRPGERLMEVPTAAELGISRTPVREAMGRLAEEGLLERKRSGGYRVRAFSFADVVDAIELRGVIEGTAARLAAERGVGGDVLARLRGIVAEINGVFAADAMDFEAYEASNMAFHDLLWHASGSDVVRREARRISALPFASPSAFTPDSTAIADFEASLVIAQDQHRRIVEAIAGREGARAEALAREHARIALRNLEYLKGRPGVEGLALVADPDATGDGPGIGAPAPR